MYFYLTFKQALWTLLDQQFQETYQQHKKNYHLHKQQVGLRYGSNSKKILNLDVYSRSQIYVILIICIVLFIQCFMEERKR